MRCIVIFDLEEMEHEDSESMTKQFVSANSFKKFLKLVIITKSYSFKDLFICSEQAHLARLAFFTGLAQLMPNVSVKKFEMKFHELILIFVLTLFFLSPFFATQSNIFEVNFSNCKSPSGDLSSSTDWKIVKLVTRHLCLLPLFSFLLD